MKKHSVNPGDAKALAHMVNYLKPKRVLEVGTHTGGSTEAIAAQLPKNSSMVTVDIKDCREAKEILSDFPVKFVQEKSQAFLRRKALEADEKAFFDFIFIDGSHDEDDVYHDLAWSLCLLEDNGLIAIHDYFPDEQPLWPDGKVIPGPFRAVQRLKQEIEQTRIEKPELQPFYLEVTPLGTLPWPTKQETNITSLATIKKIYAS